ncbi:ABC transporter permease [Haliscomenobacter sp.]|uniref:ABC transporter permease n=1 Tax=Haliscomenobacter sp. TaxID=2717303 RepID=UPI003BAD6D9D
MFKNYLTVAIRSLLKHKGYSLINILGLALGVACCLLILIYVAAESNYDRQWPNAERIYRMSLERIYPDRSTGYAIVPPSYAQSVKHEWPEVEEAVRISTNGGATLLKRGDKVFEEENVLFVDSTFFKVFQIELLQGDADKCLRDANSIVLTESTARRYFGKTRVVGENLQLLGGPEPQQLSVAAVCADLPENVHFKFDLLVSSKGNQFLAEQNHIGFAANTYFLLREGSDAKALDAKFPAVVEKYAVGEIQRNFGVTWAQYKAAGNGYHYYLTALPDIHLHSHLEGELQPNGDANTVRIFTWIALFILLIAGVNFMNLATARSAERAREVGIRKALGSERSLLTAQFLIEALLVSAASVAIAVLLVFLALPAFNRLADKQFSLWAYLDWSTVPGLLGFAVVLGLLAGLYPASVLSGFRPIEVLKGKFSSKKSGAWLRNGLVVFQFAASIAMIISTLVVFSQMGFISNKKLGFQKEQIFVLHNAFALREKTDAFKQQLLKIPGVEAVGGTSEMPGGEAWFGTTFKKPEDNESVTGRAAIVDDDYVQTMKLELLAGRTFSKQFNDSLSVIINERAAKDLGFGPNSVGKRLIQPGSFFDPNQGDVAFTVIGVVSDFHYQSLHEPIAPLFLQHNRVFQGNNTLLAARVQMAHNQSFIQEAQKYWSTFAPDQPFHYSSLDDNLNDLYANEKRTQLIFGIFAFLAVFIACIGLLGLSTYMTYQRTKEIGVRKVLGASVVSITNLLAKDFLKLVLIAIVLATPVSWYLMDRWLADFAYRIQLQWWMFVLAGLLAVVIAFLTISFQSVKAALMNPVKSLRSE